MMERFRYRKDRKDRWTILGGDNWDGDCEDFALTVAWGLAGQSWLRFWWMVLIFQIVFWRASTPAGPHVMLWVKGRGWIDNWYPKWEPKPRHRRRWPYIAPLLAIVLALK